MTASAERPLEVALDATALLGPRTGIGEFCSQLLAQLAGRPDVSPGAFAVSRAGRDALAPLLPPGARLLGRPGPGLPARALHQAWLRVAFPRAELFIGPADVVHGTNFVVPPARAGTVVTVHDLSPLHYPQWCDPAARAYPALVRKAVERGAFVHADSEFVAAEVVELLGAPPERVRAVHLGVDMPAYSALGPPRGGGGDGPGLPSSSLSALAGLLPDWATGYVLAMSRVEPRKDFPGLVRAFERIAGRHPGLALVLVGPDGNGSAQLQKVLDASPARAQVARLGWVSDEHRNALLQGATVFAYPSLYEGFGLPPLQAMAAGVPVVATSAGAMEEVLGGAARLVPVGDLDALAGAIDELVDDPDARYEMSKRGWQQAGLYTWGACADGLVSLYQDAAKPGG